MNRTRDREAETEELIAAAKRVRSQLDEAVSELDQFVQALHDEIERLNRRERSP